MQIFGLKNCDTCRKALKTLENATFFDVRDEPLPDELLRRALAEFPDDLLNTRSTTWRGLSAEEQARPVLELLKAHPALMKRPLFLREDGKMFLGWTAKTQTQTQITAA
ncbi:MAG: arsenate reductase [Rhodobacteraceae bacterium]|nr:arsenate reductase [Paracoccaceae bacterium]